MTTHCPDRYRHFNKKYNDEASSMSSASPLSEMM